jgi:hypothetical protein
MIRIVAVPPEFAALRYGYRLARVHRLLPQRHTGSPPTRVP